MPDKPELDVRQLQPRDRHPRIFSRFDALNPGEAFVLVNDHEPKPLYYQFQAERPGEVGWELIESGPERWAVRIAKLGVAAPTAESAARPTEPIRAEHRELVPHIEELRALGEAAEAGNPELPDRLSMTVAFLRDHLLVHAEAEEQVLYPAVARLLGAERATATMSQDHVAVGGLTSELATLSDVLAARPVTLEDLVAVRRLAFGLHALVTVHFAKEEEVYLPLLDAHLTTEAASDLFAAMERAAAEIRRTR